MFGEGDQNRLVITVDGNTPSDWIFIETPLTCQQGDNRENTGGKANSNEYGTSHNFIERYVIS